MAVQDHGAPSRDTYRFKGEKHIFLCFSPLNLGASYGPVHLIMRDGYFKMWHVITCVPRLELSRIGMCSANKKWDPFNNMD